MKDEFLVHWTTADQIENNQKPGTVVTRTLAEAIATATRIAQSNLWFWTAATASSNDWSFQHWARVDNTTPDDLRQVWNTQKQELVLTYNHMYGTLCANRPVPGVTHAPEETDTANFIGDCFLPETAKMISSMLKAKLVETP